MLSSLLFLLISAVLLVIKRNNAAGVRSGIASMLLLLGFAWFWASAHARPGDAWYDLVFRMIHPLVLAPLALGLYLTIANAVVYYRQKEDDIYYD